MQKRSIETRRNIIQSALILFAEKGYEATSVSQICSKAEVSKGAFYHHFASKQAVFQLAMQEWLEGIDDQLLLARQTGGTVPEIFTQMAKMMPQVYQSATGHLPMFLEVWRQAYHDPLLLKTLVFPHDYYRKYFSNLVEAGIREGSLRKVNVQAAGRVVVALAVGLLLQGLIETETDLNNVMEESISLLMHGLLRR
jgi:AcrR family transcriptional regulator